jgi:hypothetical protein
VAWPESLRVRTAAALADLERDLRELRPRSDEDVLGVAKRVVLVLNNVNADHLSAGLVGYQAGEREELRAYINASLAESGIDVEALG